MRNFIILMKFETNLICNFFPFSFPPPPVIPRMMTKHAQNRKRFGRRNFKQRYFRLTTHSLSYAKAKGKRPICDIPLTELIAVERLEEKSFKLQNIFKVSYFKNFILCNESIMWMWVWVDLVFKVRNKKNCCNSYDRKKRIISSNVDDETEK